MKFILVPMKPIPKQPTVRHRPENLGEMQQAFLNANNKKSWAVDEQYPDRRLPKAVFNSYREVKLAIWKQQRTLKKKDRRAELQTLKAKLTYDGPWRCTRFEEAITASIWRKDQGNAPELLELYLESLRHPRDWLWLDKLKDCSFQPHSGHVVHPDDNRWDRGDKPSVFVQLMTARPKAKVTVLNNETKE